MKSQPKFKHKWFLVCFSKNGSAKKRKTVSLQYEPDNVKRTKARSKRRMTIFAKAHELCTVAGGEIFVRYKDEYGMFWTYSSSDGLWQEYESVGLHMKDSLTESRCTVDPNQYTLEPEDNVNAEHQSAAEVDNSDNVDRNIHSTPEPNRPRVNKDLTHPPSMSSIDADLDMSAIPTISTEEAISDMITDGLQHMETVDISGIITFAAEPETSMGETSHQVDKQG